MEILRALLVKELRVKYKRSVFGFFWSLLTPILLAIVYFFVFVHVYRVDKQDYILFLLSGLLPWQYFNMSILAATSSIVEADYVIRKVYLPRLLIPTSSVIANLVNFLLAFGLLGVVLAVTGRPILSNLHWVLIALIIETMVCLGGAYVLSVWNVYFRDIRQLISILMIVLFFATPIVYDLDQVPQDYVPLILANPLSSVMHIIRASMFYGEVPETGIALLGLAEGIALLGMGALVFRRHSPRLAKEI